MSSYASLAEVRSWLAVGDAYDDAELAFALDSAESAIDDHVGFPFTLAGSATARVFDATSLSLLDIAGESSTIASTSGLIVKTDDNDDGTYETTWASTDYQLLPLNGRGPGGATWPCTQLRAVGNYSWPVGGVGRPRVQITAVWGWAAVPSRVRQATIMLAVAWHQRRNTMTGRGGFDGFFASAIADDQTISDLLAPFCHGTAIVGMG